MKKTIFGFGLLVMMAVSQLASAQTATPNINRRQGNQQRRIEQGVNSGQLTPKETGRMEAREAHIQQQKRMYKAQGHVTAGERAQLHREQNRTSRAIYNHKHNAKVM